MTTSQKVTNANSAIAVKPCTRDTVEHRVMSDGRAVVTADGEAHLSLTREELEFLYSLDGTVPVPHLESHLNGNGGELLEDFASAGLLEGCESPTSSKLTFTRSGVEFPGFRRFVVAVHRFGGRLFLTTPGIVMIVATTLVGLVLLTTTAASSVDTSNHFPGPVVVLALSLSGIAAAVIHETAHALVIHDKGRTVGAAGMGFYWGALSFYVDATDALLLPKRARLVQGVAGPIADALLAAVLTLIAVSLNTASPWRPLLVQISVLLWIDVVLNLCPILELDGYWAIADALDRPQLRAESYNAIRRLFNNDHSTGTVRLATFGLSSIVAGLALIGLSVWLWIHVYTDLVAETWMSGVLGKSAVVVWLGPTVLGMGASAVGWIQSRITPDINPTPTNS